jgi:hypothetical protein
MRRSGRCSSCPRRAPRTPYISSPAPGTDAPPQRQARPPIALGIEWALVASPYLGCCTCVPFHCFDKFKFELLKKDRMAKKSVQYAHNRPSCKLLAFEGNSLCGLPPQQPLQAVVRHGGQKRCSLRRGHSLVKRPLLISDTNKTFILMFAEPSSVAVFYFQKK